MSGTMHTLSYVPILCPLCGIRKAFDSFLDPLNCTLSILCKECRTTKQQRTPPPVSGSSPSPLCAHSQQQAGPSRARSISSVQSEEEPSRLSRSSSQMPRGEAHRALLSSLHCQTSLPSHALFIGAFLRVHSGSIRFFRLVCSSPSRVSRVDRGRQRWGHCGSESRNSVSKRMP